MGFSGHCLFVGATGCGKTTLAKRMASRFSASGTPILLLAPFNDPEWGADFFTDDPQVFLDVVFNHRRCLIAIDEAGEFAGQYDKTMQTIATRGRHYGHLAFFIAQRAKMVNVNIRTNCVNLYLFRSSSSDCRMLADDFAVDDLTPAAKLPKGVCLAVDEEKTPYKIKVF